MIRMPCCTFSTIYKMIDERLVMRSAFRRGNYMCIAVAPPRVRTPLLLHKSLLARFYPYWEIPTALILWRHWGSPLAPNAASSSCWCLSEPALARVARHKSTTNTSSATNPNSWRLTCGCVVLLYELLSRLLHPQCRGSAEFSLPGASVQRAVLCHNQHLSSAFPSHPSGSSIIMGKGECLGSKQLQSYTWEEIAEHKTTDKWIVIDGLVYDITNWQKKHPGGAKILGHYVGQDATVSIYFFLEDRAWKNPWCIKQGQIHRFGNFIADWGDKTRFA